MSEIVRGERCDENLIRQITSQFFIVAIIPLLLWAEKTLAETVETVVCERLSYYFCVRASHLFFLEFAVRCIVGRSASLLCDGLGVAMPRTIKAIPEVRKC